MTLPIEIIPQAFSRERMSRAMKSDLWACLARQTAQDETRKDG